MDFINKLIKKGTFCLILVFGFFVFTNGINVDAAVSATDCQISLKDNDKYLVLSTTSKWNDSGVSATCSGGTVTNISIIVNGGSQITTTDSAEGAINAYLTKSGFYSVEYRITDATELIYGKTFITRKIRVLPTNLNEDKNMWLGETNFVDSSDNDFFTKIINVDGGYLAVGKLEKQGYVVKYNVRGEYEWSWTTSSYAPWQTSEIEISDIIVSTTSSDTYYISGLVTDGAITKGFIKPINVTLNVGVDNTFGNVVVFDDLYKINKIVMVNNYIVGAGYKISNEVNVGVLVRKMVDTETKQLVGATAVYMNNLDGISNSEYTSIIKNSGGKVVAVGYQDVPSSPGAIGGAITICSVDSGFSCETQKPQLYKVASLGNTTITRFNDIVEVDDGYLIVGDSRISVIEEGSAVSYNSGKEDLLVVYGYFDFLNEFSIECAKLSGGSSSDALYSIEKINDNKYITVGKVANYAYYGEITLSTSSFELKDNFMSGNSYAVLNDVAVRISSDNEKEVQYIFAGVTKSTVFEGMLTYNQGYEDSLLVILYDVLFDNYGDIALLTGDSICADGTTSCEGSGVSEEYWLVYGNNKYPFLASVDTNITQSKTINTIHEFSNEWGVKFKIGKSIVIVYPQAPSDIVLGEMGIDKWWLYYRKENVGANANQDNNISRIDTWDQYYYPVADGKTKSLNKTYYKLRNGVFIVDTATNAKTSNNYIMLTPGYVKVDDGLEKEANQYYKLVGEDYVLDDTTGTTLDNYKLVSIEPKKNNVAFQSVEKAKEYAELQEYTRIAFVKEKFSSATGIKNFGEELESLQNQNYYFIYYIDFTFGEGECKTENMRLVGNCNNYMGYAFSNLGRISQLVSMVIESNNYFVSESQQRYVLNKNLPTSEEFKEEVSTIEYVKTKEIVVPANIYLNVEFYSIDKTVKSNFTFSTTPVVSKKYGQTIVTFKQNGTYSEEGKYVVKYCSSVACGKEAAFVIDRSGPIINYLLDDGKSTEGSITLNWTRENWYKMKADADITSITDIDPYAYILVSGQKYFLTCNKEINSANCDKEYQKFIKQQFKYDKEDPDKIYYIEVYDRAGNSTTVNFKVATKSPTVKITYGELDENGILNDFTLEINFHEKNAIDSIGVYFTQEGTCTNNCTIVDDIPLKDEDGNIIKDEFGNDIYEQMSLKTKIERVINALKYHNQLEAEKLKAAEEEAEKNKNEKVEEEIEGDETEEDEEENQVGYIPNFIESLIMEFSLTLDETDEITTGAKIYKLEYDEEAERFVLATDENGDFLYEFLPISKGLYKFSVTDVFEMTSSQTAGIGIAKAELDVFINGDENYTDDQILSSGTNQSGSDPTINIPEVQFTEPGTYSEYMELFPQAAIDSSIYYTNKYIYVKFRATSYSETEISIALTGDGIGNAKNGDDSTFNCLFVLYAYNYKVIDGGITTMIENPGLVESGCSRKIGVSTIANDDNKSFLESLGIYSLGVHDDYYYFAFTKEGMYHVKSSINPPREIDDEDALTSLTVDTEKVFVIDKTKPEINVQKCIDTLDEEGNVIGTNCVDANDFIDNDADVNIGTHYIVINWAEDKFNGVVNAINGRLLLVRVNGTLHNAYAHAGNGYSLAFKDTNKYEIVFIDVGGNETFVKFTIDKKAPTIGNFEDVDAGKDVTQYQQYLDVKVTVTENTLLEDTNSTQLTIKYWLDKTVDEVKEEDKTRLEIINNNGVCQISEGQTQTGQCSFDSGGIVASFVLSINEEERLTHQRTLYVEAYDYFGNASEVKSQKFAFDNASPYIYYDSSYTPSTIYDVNADESEKDKWIAIDANASLGTFECDTQGVAIITGDIKINCVDAPSFANKNNNVKVEAYEAYKAANSNFYYNAGNYYPFADGTYINPQIKLYKSSQYRAFKSAAEVQTAINEDIYIFYHVEFFQVTTSDKVDPNTTYYYGDSKTEVSIANMYDDYKTYNSYATCTGDDAACKLYKMYAEGEGKFTDTNFYYKDSKKYVWVQETDSIDISKYNNYYYAVDGKYYEDEDFTDNYLPAQTLANTKVELQKEIAPGEIETVYEDVPKDRIKILDSNALYYIEVIKSVSQDNVTTYDKILDTRIWLIAENEKFAFGLKLSSTKEYGRPIIFKAIDGAGNEASNYLETVIKIKDSVVPKLNEVFSIKYTLDTSGGQTKDNYIRVTKYYKVGDIEGLNCETSTTAYYTDINGTQSVNCDDMVEGNDYYAAVKEYEKVADGLPKDARDYYTLTETKITDSNYLTKDNFTLVFSEPIYRVTCSYYDSEEKATKLCDFSNTEYEYKDEKTTFSFINDEIDRYINYQITVYDFSNNSYTITDFVIDREAPTIVFKDGEKTEEEKDIETNYKGDSNTNYNPSYVNENANGEVKVTDSIDSISSIINNKSYTIKMYAYNYNVTYKNYTRSGNSFTPVTVGLGKVSGTDYYILIKKPTDYELKDMEKVCIKQNGEDYCYVKDEQNYYPGLLNDERYWTLIEDNTILKNKVGVYKITYQVKDQVGNESNIITRVIYVEDNTAPSLYINGSSSDSSTGYHNYVTVSFDGEGEYKWVQYDCVNTNEQCILPSNMFGSHSSREEDIGQIDETGRVTATYTSKGLYRVYLYDKGNYVNGEISDGTKVKTLKYNYKQYTFVIDTDAPTMKIDASIDEDDNNNLYYIVTIEGDDASLYCVRGDLVYSGEFNLSTFDKNNKLCEDFLDVRGEELVTDNFSGLTKIIQKDNSNRIVSIITYKKIPTSEIKYFYNIYYKLVGNQFIQYSLNDIYDDENVYQKTHIQFNFRVDGKYAIQVSDRADNDAGRTYKENNQPKVDAYYSKFEIDNTAPDHNKNQNKPTGINYWFSVPSKVVYSSSEIALLNSISKPNQSTSYDITSSGLNNSFFYAFATSEEAKQYLLKIYIDDITINGVAASCNGVAGKRYNVYDKDQGRTIELCLPSDNTTALSAVINKMVFPTFSGNTLFGDSIAQTACDSTVSEKCLNNKDMYKVIYLKKDSSNASTTVAETCVEEGTITCIKVNTKIIKYDNDNTENNKLLLQIKGDNTLDTETIKWYRLTLNSNGNTEGSGLYDQFVSLYANSYYIFEEVDKTITYINSSTGNSTSHYNTTYYAIFVDDGTGLDRYGQKNNKLTINGVEYIRDDKYIKIDNKVEGIIEGTIENPIITMNDGTIYTISGTQIKLGNEIVGTINTFVDKIITSTILTNADEYYLILKPSDMTAEARDAFIRAYEIHEVWGIDGEGNPVLTNVYSYLRVKVGKEDNYVNINDYIHKYGNEYHISIPLSAEQKTTIILKDRAETETEVVVSRTQKAPEITVSYDGLGGNSTVQVTIKNNQLSKLDTTSVELLFSKDGVTYSSDDTGDILRSLVCKVGSNGSTDYGCSNEGENNGIAKYVVKISNFHFDGDGNKIPNSKEFRGFFKISFVDDHGNANSIQFIYNPMDLDATYETTGLQYIDLTPHLNENKDIRMITNKDLQIKWDNEWNYLILYKLVEGELVEVCNTKDMEAATGNCKEKIEDTTNPQTGYEYSILYYEEEGVYEAKLFNRLSEVIYDRCYNEDGTLKEECKEIKTYHNNNCSWENNVAYCAGGFQVLSASVSKTNNNTTYTRFEIDKTKPNYNIKDFIVELPTGVVDFKENGEYVNGKVTVKWLDSFVELYYTCEYIDAPAGTTCQGNRTGKSLTNKEYTFEVTNKMSTKYTFYLEDIAGNSTANKLISFTIKIELPKIKVFQRDDNTHITTIEVENNSKINKNVELICYRSNGQIITEKDGGCESVYDVKLYVEKDNGYVLKSSKNNTVITESGQNKYKYIVSIKSTTGYVYENLSSEIEFTIDKQAPNITINGNKDDIWGIYTGEVRVIVDNDGTGTIYGNCVEIGVDNVGDKIYECDQTNPLVEEFKYNYTLSETGTYMITAVDEIGNVTKGKAIQYVTIDNDKPKISVKASNEYLEYELSENGYTNVASVVVTSTDNNPQSYFVYRVKKGAEDYGEWITHASNSLVISEEGMYEVKPVDIVGNEGITRHFIIYRQAPKYSIFVGNSSTTDTSNQIITQDVRVSWSEPEYETEAPIVKVTINGRTYNRGDAVTETGEYVFVFTDLAGNKTTHKLTINKDPNICLDNVKLIPNKQYLFNVQSMKISGGEGYTFKEDDVIIFATPTNYYGGSSACGENILCYKTLDKGAYILLTKSVADYINKNKNVSINLSQKYVDEVNELGGYVYAFIVDLDVAKNELGFDIGESFFTQDPLGWTLIFLAGVGLIYVGLKLVVFKKRVKVLK